MKKTGTPASASGKNAKRKRARIAKIALHLGLATLTAPMMVQANEVTAPPPKETVIADNRNYSIARQPLYSALSALAEQAGIQFVYNAEMVKGLTSQSVQGQYTTETALQKVLSGTGISFRRTGPNTVALEQNRSAKEPDATTLKAMTVVGKSNSDSDPTAYKVSNASTATKMDTPIMETPYSVAVVSQQVIKDQQVIRVEDALTNVAGVQPSYQNSGLNDAILMRGFETTTLYRDGFLLPSGFGNGNTKRQTANIDRIEVLKGPGSILYGRNEPGGVINLVTKRPQATPYHSVQQQFGSYDLYRTTVDSTGGITPDDKLLYRVNLSYENAGSFRDFVKTDSVFFAPSLTWNISDRTQANLDIEYQHFDNTMDAGIPKMGNRPAPVPRNLQPEDPLNNKSAGDRTAVNFHWSHAFNDKWKLNHKFSAEFLDQAQLYMFTGEADAVGDLWRGTNNANFQSQSYSTSLNLTGKFDTAKLAHTMLWGFDYFANSAETQSNCCPALPAFNIFNPTYLTTAPTNNLMNDPHRSMDWYSLYWQDQIKFPFNIYGNVGLRYDNAVGRNDTAGEITTSDDSVTPRGGLLWKPVEWLSVYGNYSENFGPSNSFWGGNPSQPALPPQTAQGWELGTKTEFLDGRLSASFAYFDLTKQNLSVPDPATPGLMRAIGEQESRGYEFEATGEILPGWKVIGAYTHMPYANINKDVSWGGGGPGNTGNRMPNAPHNFGSLWNTYEFQNAALRGLKLGGGVIASGQKQGDTMNDWQLPGYVTVNLLASYGLKVAGKKLTLQLNANNLLDKNYYAGSNSWSQANVGTPRSFLGSVRLEF